MISLNAVLIDCGLGELTHTLYIDINLAPDAVIRVQQALAKAVAQEMISAGLEFKSDFKPMV